jgi:hypothetical protein
MNWSSISFISWPLALGVAAVAVPALILLYLLKLRRRDMEISTTLLWKKAVQDLQANAPLQRLRKNILLLLQLLVLAALIFALAEPVMKSASFTGTKHVILIDRSASMATLDASDNPNRRETRLEEAKRQAIAMIESLREPGLIAKATNAVGDEAMVIAFDNVSDVRQSFTSDKQKLRAAVESITQSDAPTSMGEAMRLAKAHAPKRLHVENNQTQVIEGLSGGAPISIHLFSDGRVPDADAAKPSPEDSFVFHRIGSEKSGNVGITSVRAQRSYENPNALSFFVGLQNSDPAERTVDVELVVEGSVAAIKQVTMPGATKPAADGANPAATPKPDQPQGANADVSGDEQQRITSDLNPGVGGVVFNVEREDALLAETRLRAPTGSGGDLDAFPTDDRVYVNAGPAKRLRVAIVTSGSLFLSSALAGLPLAELKTVTPTEYKALADKGTTLPADVIILDGTLPAASANAPAAGLPPGRYLILNAVPTPKTASQQSPPPLTDKGKGGNATIVDWQRTHPALRNVGLDSVFLAETRDVDVRPGSTAVTLARTERGPAIIELSSGPTRALIVPFDIGATNWPLDVSFVVFLASAIDYLGGESLAGSTDTPQMGSTISERLPTGATDIRLLGPGETSEATLTPLPDGSVVFGPVRRAGVYRLSWKGPAAPGDLTEGQRAVRRVPANLLDAPESVVASKQTIALASRVVNAAGSDAFKGDQKLWPWLLLACAAMLMIEWYVYNKKTHL